MQSGNGPFNVNCWRPPNHQIFSPNFTMPSASSPILDPDSHQQPAHMQNHFLFPRNDQLQPSDMIFGTQNLIGHQVVQQQHWRSDAEEGTGIQENFYGGLEGLLASELREFENQSSGSAGELRGTQNFPNPNSNSEPDQLTDTLNNSCSKCNGIKFDYEKKLENQMKLMAQSLEERLIAHQENLYQRFIEKLEASQAMARAHDQVLASKREAVIVSYLEKITGERTHLHGSENIVIPNSSPVGGPSSSPDGGDGGGRWPSSEVDALAGVRIQLDPKFRGPGLKTALWEEVSSRMEKLGYLRNAKRCKEKWDNINKYYLRKLKDVGGSAKKKGTKRRSKTCSYFGQLEQYYSSAGTESEEMDHNIDSKADVNMYINNVENNNVENKNKDCCDDQEQKRDGEDQNQVLLEPMLDLESKDDPSHSTNSN